MRGRWIVALGAAVATAGLIAPVTAASSRAVSPGPSGRIKHIVVFFQENRSFDEVLGAFCRDHGNRCDGYVGPVKLRNGTTVPMIKSPDVVLPDPSHTVGTQMQVIDHGRMDGWNGVPACDKNGVNQCVSYYSEAQIPALAALAGKYVVSDHTFSLGDSPSWTGHMAVVAATQDHFYGSIPAPAPGVPQGPGWGCDSNRVSPWIDPQTHVMSDQPSCIPARPGVLNAQQYPYNGPFRRSAVPYVPTILDRLDAAKLPWRLYASVGAWSICPTFAECQYGAQHANVVPPAQILTDARDGKLPAYSVLLPSGPGNGTGQHPPGSMLVGDNWIGKVVNALQASPEWSSTAIFITYDDCGCFYDHVAPGKNPDGTQRGLREPTVIISPYAKRSATDTHVATFASMLRFAEEAFGLAPLGVNDAQAYDYGASFNFAAAPTSPRVWLHQSPVPASTLRQLAAIPPDDTDPT